MGDDSRNNQGVQGTVTRPQANMGDGRSLNRDGITDDTGDADGQRDDGTSNSGPGGHLEGDIDELEQGEGERGAGGALEGTGSTVGHRSEDRQQDEPEDDEDEEGNRGPPRGPPEDRDSGELLLQETSSIADVEITLKFIKLLRTATLEKSGMEPEDIELLRKPADYPLEIDDTDLLLGIKIYKACSLASEATYTSTRQAILERFPDCQMPSLDQVKRRVKNLSDVKPIVNHMCEKSCVAFTGPFEDLTECPKCLSPRYTKPGSLEPRKTFSTIPIGPQIQALYRDAASARKMKYRRQKTAEVIAKLQRTGGELPEYDDFTSGREYLNAVQSGLIKDNDTVLMYSLDGCQLYRSKTSDCWIFVWIFMDLDGDFRYKKVHVSPGIVIAGPDKPQNLDSFLFPTFYHVAALQLEGLQIWDADLNATFISNLFLLFGIADGPGLALHNGLVGHKGHHGCRLHCPIISRHKPGEPVQYPVLLLPHGYTVEGCDHPDVDIRALSASYVSSATINSQYRVDLNAIINSRTTTEYKGIRLKTGVVKPCLIEGLPRERSLGVITMNTLDFMHIPALNIPDLLFSLFRGKIVCEKTDDKRTWDWAVLQGKTWKTHGAEVAACTPYLPGSFDRPPRNPAEKISSGYKAWEFLIYIYSLGPALFYGVLPDKYWQNLCLLVQGIRILLQRKITRAQLCFAHTCLIEFMIQFEELYYQRRADRIHFVRQSIHILAHGAPETVRIGPAANVTQWTMERTIGNLGEEIRLHSNPYQNITQRSIYRAQMNALQAMIPSLQSGTTSTPQIAIDLDQGYVLLHARDTCARQLPPLEQAALAAYLMQHDIDGTINQVVRWARLALPNGQIARSRWKELQCHDIRRIARQVKVLLPCSYLLSG
ncbi:hypothetical protein CCMSSC00406_0006207 [Pleurotus cornucopiae]|uniref:Uncharacterized protein n=1 Tax=Pleurotus cornucopiae TaxID=5321 RepID=A0ACB7J607_PLECO|nr:hypothetical protein CCMSSC00406_0006207 [Pleurotus cornucopiae]